MQRPAAIQRDEIGDIDQRGYRAQADGFQQILKPLRRRTVLHAADQAAREHRSRVCLTRGEIQRGRDRRFERSGHRRQIAFPKTPKTGRCQIACDAIDTRRIATVGRDRDVDHRIVEAQRLRRRLAHFIALGGKARADARCRSSPSRSSREEHSMPRDSNPRIVPILSASPLTGITTPGFANTAFMPVCAFGAPQTTWTGVPDPSSTMQSFSLSALGCRRRDHIGDRRNPFSCALRRHPRPTPLPDRWR